MQICYNLLKTNDLNKDGDQMANYTEAQWNAKKIEMMEKCFEAFSEMGLHRTEGTGVPREVICIRVFSLTSFLLGSG